ncbi:MAG: FHA domain-containing protein, partial [Cyanobacteria bacterium P01_D01_bin.44]
LGDVQTAAVITTPQTRLQRNMARLLHVQTDAVIELAPTLSVIRLGKPNDRVPPDIDISGFPDSEIVSRTHANIRVEGDVYYIEDVGSSNGTYINNLPLPQGNRHRLRPGDRIALGKGDKVSFIFQLA